MRPSVEVVAFETRGEGTHWAMLRVQVTAGTYFVKITTYAGYPWSVFDIRRKDAMRPVRERHAVGKEITALIRPVLCWCWPVRLGLVKRWGLSTTELRVS